MHSAASKTSVFKEYLQNSEFGLCVRTQGTVTGLQKTKTKIKSWFVKKKEIKVRDDEARSTETCISCFVLSLI